MPRGLTIISIVNAVLLALFAGNLVIFYASASTHAFVFISSWIAVVGLTAVFCATLVRSRLWHRIARAALYLMCLCFGVQIMGMVAELNEPIVAGGIVGLTLIVIYFVGVRGYLNSAPARRWFHLASQPQESEEIGRAHV